MKIALSHQASRPLARALLGPELVVNAEFAADTAGWTAFAGTPSAAAHEGILSSDGTNQFPYLGQQLSNLESGAEYNLQWNFRGDQTCQIFFRPNGVDNSAGQVATTAGAAIIGGTRFIATLPTLFIRATIMGAGIVPAGVKMYLAYVRCSRVLP